MQFSDWKCRLAGKISFLSSFMYLNRSKANLCFAHESNSPKRKSEGSISMQTCSVVSFISHVTVTRHVLVSLKDIILYRSALKLLTRQPMNSVSSSDPDWLLSSKVVNDSGMQGLFSISEQRNNFCCWCHGEEAMNHLHNMANLSSIFSYPMRRFNENGIRTVNYYSLIGPTC